MNKRFDKSPLFNVIGLAAGSITGLLIALAISLTLDVQPVDDSAGIDMAQTDSIHG